MTIETSEHTTPNGAPYTGKEYKQPGFSAAVVVGDVESFSIRSDWRMTFYPNEVRQMAYALLELANWMDRPEDGGWFIN